MVRAHTPELLAEAGPSSRAPTNMKHIRDCHMLVDEGICSPWPSVFGTGRYPYHETLSVSQPDSCEAYAQAMTSDPEQRTHRHLRLLVKAFKSKISITFCGGFCLRVGDECTELEPGADRSLASSRSFEENV